MNKYLKIIGCVFAGILLCLYLAFVFILPKVIDLNKYKPDIQNLVTDNTGLNIDFDRADVITSPWLEAGVKISNIKVTLPDNSVLFSADAVKGKVFLPSLLWLTVKVSCADIDSPYLNIEIFNSEQFKVARLYEDLVNKQREQRRLNPVEQEQTAELPFDVSKIRVKVPSLKLNNYKAVIDDTDAGHKLTLKGGQLKLGYFNGKSVKLKTTAELLSDDNTNITANLDIDTFIPEFQSEPEEYVNEEAVFALPFINPVSTYRDYNLTSDITSKIKIRQNKRNKRIVMNGFADIENTTVTMSGLQLPKSYFRMKAHGTTVNIDTNIYFTSDEYINLLCKSDYGKKPYIDLKLKSPEVHFANMLNIARAYLDTVHIQNNLKNMTASGYMLSNASLKTDFHDIVSDGKFVIRDGNIADKNIGLLFNDIFVNVFLDDNIVRVDNSGLLINKRPLNISGKIDSNSIANFRITGDRIPLPELYAAFAPGNIKREYNLNSGFLTIEAGVRGEIKDITAMLKTNLDKLVISDRSGNFILSNESAHFGLANYSGKILGKVHNKGFNLSFPKTNASIKDNSLVANIDNKQIVIDNSVIRINKTSDITFSGQVKNYLTKAETQLNADGKLASSDIAAFAGEEAVPYLDLKGFIPVKAAFNAQGANMKLVAQAMADNGNYITPVKLDALAGKQSLFQLILTKHKDTLKINKSGLFTRKHGAPFGDKLYSNLSGAKEVVSIRAMISNLDTDPFINLFKVTIPNNLGGSIFIFPKSRFTFGGHLFVFGNVNSPRISAHFDLRELGIPEILTQMRLASFDMNTNDIRIDLNDLNANGSDFRIRIQSNRDLIARMILSDVKVTSRLINVDKLMEVSDSLMKSLPASGTTTSSAAADIPVTVQNGSIRLNKIVTGNITANNTTGRISLYKNVFCLNRLRTYSMGGVVTGNVSMNLLTTELAAKLSGKDFDVDKILVDVMDMKDTLSGTMNFIADISLKGAELEEQMKTLKGYVDFTIKNGQLGPFGKFENFLMAENIRENAFFSSTIGSVITNIVTIDTSHFNDLYGHITFKDGIADIAPIKSQGDVMSLYIAGSMNLLDNTADMKVRGKLASAFSDSLGVLSNINPVNLVKHTPGLNIAAVKAFSIFCEAVSEEEMAALPELGKGKTDENATKFQIVLRGDTTKPLKMIKSFKWLALNSEIESAQNFVDTLPTPAEGEEDLSVEELIKLKEEQAAAAAQNKTLEQIQKQEQNPSFFDKLKSKFNK